MSEVHRKELLYDLETDGLFQFAKITKVETNKTTFSHRGTLGISHQVHPQTLRIDLRAQRYLFAKNRQNRVERYKQTILFLGVCGIIVQKTAKVPRKHSP